MPARMPAMINRLMPLPMPNSSICSPSHIRKMVPAVMVITVDQLPAEAQRAARSRNVVAAPSRWRIRKPDVEPALTEAQHDGGVARVFVDFLAAALAFFLQLLERLPDAAQELENDRGRDVGHDAQAEDRDLVELRGAEHGHLLEQSPHAAALLEERRHLALVDDRQRNLPADAIDRPASTSVKQDLLPQLGNREDDANFFPHGSLRPCSMPQDRASAAIRRRHRVAAIDRSPVCDCANVAALAVPRSATSPACGFVFGCLLA